ncbi:MAG TPA: NAD(P)-dependent oxidoreductase [Negativicutes bacterium]|nr:NAD(P)-dependent oxidoreductase [Negativicutes bacterium]
MFFKKIVSVDNTGIKEAERARLRAIAEEVIFYDDYPTVEAEILQRISDADAVLVSWNTLLPGHILRQCPRLRYIGMCCSLYDEKSANVDIAAAREQGITVQGVRDYGDEGMAEFVICELICLLKGLHRHQWKYDVQELTNQKIGFIGLGATGSMLADRASAFGMQIYYYGRTRKKELEAKGYQYMELLPLLQTVDIVSTHLPKHTVLLGDKEFDALGTGKILVNTSLEPTFDMQAFDSWIRREGNYAIFDRVAMGLKYDALKLYDRVIYSDKVSGWTQQAKQRLSLKALENIERYLAELQ